MLLVSRRIRIVAVTVAVPNLAIASGRDNFTLIPLRNWNRLLDAAALRARPGQWLGITCFLHHKLSGRRCGLLRQESQ
jgi:hypothetical protein